MRKRIGRAMCKKSWLVLIIAAGLWTNALAQTPAEKGKELILLSQVAAVDNDAKRATRLLEEGLQYPLDKGFVDTLLLEIEDILSGKDRDELKKSSKPTEFLLHLWRRLDPTPATSENERYAEHIQRLNYAREHYPAATTKGYDDRGMIYLRYGPPDDSFIGSSSANFRDTESWVYHRLGEANFDFINIGATFKLSSDFQQALVSTPSNVHDQVRMMRDFFFERSDLGLLYHRVYTKLEQAMLQEFTANEPLDALLVNQVVNEYANDVDRVREKLPPSITTVGLDIKPLTFGISYARFYKENGANRLELYYGVPLDGLKFVEYTLDSLGSTLRLAFRIMDENFNPVLEDEATIALHARSEAELDTTDYVGQVTCFLPPGDYNVAMQLTNIESNKKRFYAFRLELPEFKKALIQSDLQFAKRVILDTTMVQDLNLTDRKRGFIKGKIYVEPYPYPIISKSHTVELYYEIYNLSLDKSGKAEYRIDYKIVAEKRGSGVSRLLSKMNPFSKRLKTSISTSYDREGTQARQHELLALSFADLSYGTYMLTVTVTDKHTGESVQSMKRFKLVGE